MLDPHRTGHELTYHPGEANLRLSDACLINKVDSAAPEQLELLLKNIDSANPGARVIRARSAISVDHPERIAGRRVLVV